MINFFTQLLSENGTISSMRVMSFISLFIGGYIGIIGIHSDKPLADVAILCGVFVGAAFTGKVLQKSTEMQQGKSSSEKT